MYTGTSTAFNEKVIELSRTFRVKIECGSKVIDEGFKDVTIHYQAHADEETISIGDAVAAYVTINMYKPDFTFTGKTFTLFVGLTLDDGSVEYVQMGIFTAQKPETDHGMITFTAYDCMTTTLGHAYFSSLEGTTPMFGSKEKVTDIKNVLQEIIDLSGITFVGMNDLPDGKMVTLKYLSFNDDETVIELKKTFDGDYTYREVIGYIAGCYGKFATINAQGQLEFRWYKDSGYTISKQRNCDDVVLSESKFTVKYLAVTISENNVLKTGSGTTGLNAYNPFMPDVESIKDGIIGMSYYPMTISYLGDPRIQIGDIVKIEQDDGTLLSVPVMSLTQDYDGGLTSIVGCYGNTEEADVAAGSIPDTTMALDSIKQQLLQVQEVNATTVTTEYLNANYATIQSLTAVTAEITDLKAHTVTTDYLEANYANIKLANIDTADVGLLLARSGIVSDMTMESGKVTGYLDSVLINAESIKAGVVSVDRLVINGTNESLIFALNNSGELTSTHCDTIDGGLLTKRTITADHIVTGSLTATEIDCANLKSTGFIGANKLTADNIVVTNLSAISAKVGGYYLSSDRMYYSYVTGQYTGMCQKASTTAKAFYAFATATDGTGAAWYVQNNGSMHAELGDIADFTIEQNRLYSVSNGYYVGIRNENATETKVFYAGGTAADGTGAKWYVKNDGSMYADGATIKGDIYTNGAIKLYHTAKGVYEEVMEIPISGDTNDRLYFGLENFSNVCRGALSVNGILYISSSSYFADAVVIKGQTSINNKLTVTSAATFSSSVYFADGTDYYINTSGGARVSALTCKGDAAVNSLSVTTTTTLSSTLTVASTAKFSGAVYFAGGTTYYLSTNGNINANYITAAGTATFNGAATFNSNVTFENRPKCVDSYTKTYTTAANVVVTSNGYFGRYSSSSRRYKHDIKPLNIADVRCLYNVPLHTFRYNEGYISPDDERYDKDIPGLIAEELDAVLPIAVDHIKVNGIFQAEMPNTYTLLQCTLALVQDLNNRTSFLEDNMVTNLQAQCNDLRSRLAAAELQIEQLKQAVA